MEKTWATFLNHLSSPDSKFTYDDVIEWPPEVFEGLTKAGLISETVSATHVVCDACPDKHWERVRWSEDGRRAFIPCTPAGTVNVDLKRLRLWQINVGRLAVLIKDALEIWREPQPLAATGWLWHLGRRRLGGRFRDVFFSVSSEDGLPTAIQEAQQHLSSGSGLLIAPAYARGDSGWESSRLKVIALSDIATWEGGKIALDLDFIEDIWGPGPEARRASVRSISVPDGVGWQDLLIEVDDALLRIEIGGQQKQLSFAEAGFSERDQRLETLKVLAAGRGKLVPEHVSKALQGKTPIKNRIKALRQLLLALIPIDGNPVEHNRRAGFYVCKFQVRLAGEASFPTPASASWLDFRFVERRDGRLAVSVNDKKIFRALQAERGSGRPTEEVGQRDEIVPHLYSLEDLKLRNRKGQLTPEGTALVEMLRGEGRLKRSGDDTPVLKLGVWLRKWIGLEGDPLIYSGGTRTWTAAFECSSHQGQ